jgi:hypothetical protein
MRAQHFARISKPSGADFIAFWRGGVKVFTVSQRRAAARSEFASLER